MKRLIDALGERSTRMLSIQYRMNALIMNWISEKLYDSKLIAHESVSRHLLSDIKGVEKDEITEYPLLLIDTDGCDMPEMIAASEDSNGDEESKANDGEANIGKFCFLIILDISRFFIFYQFKFANMLLN